MVIYGVYVHINCVCVCVHDLTSVCVCVCVSFMGQCAVIYGVMWNSLL